MEEDPKTFQPIFRAEKKRPEWDFELGFRTNAYLYTIFKDHFELSTWMLIGCVIQFILASIVGWRAVIPAAAVLLVRSVDTLLQVAGITKNRSIEGAILSKTGAQMPNSDGTFESTPGNGSMVVFMVGGQSNHPLGPFAPGAAENGKYFEAVHQALCKYDERHGLLGMSTWKSNHYSAGNTDCLIMFWKDIDSVHKFVHGPEHMAGVRWFSSIVKKYPHLGVFHETYYVPKGGYENVYLNCKPMLFGQTTYPIYRNLKEGEERTEANREWMRPVVDSKKGALRIFAKRMNRPDLAGHEKDEGDLWDNTAYT